MKRRRSPDSETPLSYDEQWELIEELFPENAHRGGQWKDHRAMVNAMLWWLRTGAPWRDLPERYGPWKSV